MVIQIRLKCSSDACGNMYHTKKNKRNTPDKMSIKKYCKFCKSHTVFEETKS